MRNAWLMAGLLLVSSGALAAPKADTAAAFKGLNARFFRHIPAEWDCGQSLENRLTRRDFAHSYSFPGQMGDRYTFEFSTEKRAVLGTLIVVIDAETNRVVAGNSSTTSQVSVVYEAERNVKYLVGVMAIPRSHPVKYSLAAFCERPHYCTVWETLNEDGTPLNNFYAFNVGSYEEGKQILEEMVANGQLFTSEQILEGTCREAGKLMSVPRCEEESRCYAPVCTDHPQYPTEYTNVAWFKKAVMASAGDEGNAKGHYDNGPCPAEGVCVEWEATDEYGTPQGVFLAHNAANFEDAQRVLQEAMYHVNAVITPGPCNLVGQACPEVWQPVCGAAHEPFATFSNLCEFKALVRRDAGAEIGLGAKGAWKDGMCPDVYCLNYEPADDQGNSTQTFYAENYSSWTEVMERSNQLGNVVQWDVFFGSCEQASAERVCPRLWAPVCGGPFMETRTWGNLCELKREVLLRAGPVAGVFAKGKWQQGECGTATVCLEYETTDENGVPYRNFYAHNMASREDAEALLGQVQFFVNEYISDGPCMNVGQYCPQFIQPVCADTPPPQFTHSNLCFFKAHVRAMAGHQVGGEAKGHWERGECPIFCGGIAGIPCPEGMACILDGDYPDAGGQCVPVTWYPDEGIPLQ